MYVRVLLVSLCVFWMCVEYVCKWVWVLEFVVDKLMCRMDYQCMSVIGGYMCVECVWVCMWCVRVLVSVCVWVCWLLVSVWVCCGINGAAWGECVLSVCADEWVETCELSGRVCACVHWRADERVGTGKFSVGVSVCGATRVTMHLRVCVCLVCRRKCWVSCSSHPVMLWPHSNWYHPSSRLWPRQDCSPEGRGWVWWSSVASAPCAIGCCEMKEWKERKKGPLAPAPRSSKDVYTGLVFKKLYTIIECNPPNESKWFISTHRYLY